MGICLWTGVQATDEEEPSSFLETDAVVQVARDTGGLVSVVGCRDRELISSLAKQPSLLVHGLCRETARVEEVLRFADEKGLIGSFTVCAPPP